MADAAAALGAGAAAATAADAAAAVSVVNACPVENANIAFSSTAKAAAACFFVKDTAANAVTAFAALAIALVAACAAVLHAVIATIIVVAVFAAVVYAAKVVSAVIAGALAEVAATACDVTAPRVGTRGVVSASDPAYAAAEYTTNVIAVFTTTVAAAAVTAAISTVPPNLLQYLQPPLSWSLLLSQNSHSLQLTSPRSLQLLLLLFWGITGFDSLSSALQQTSLTCTSDLDLPSSAIQ